MTKEYRFRVYTGPVGVPEFAEAFSHRGGFDIVQGTEHVYVTFPADSQELARSKAVGVKGVLYKDIYCIRESVPVTTEPAESSC